MENENIKKDTEMQEEVNPLEETTNVDKTIAEPIEENASETGEEIATETDVVEEVETEDVETVVGDEVATEENESDVTDETSAELSEEEIAAIAALKKQKRKRGIITAAVIAAVLAVAAFFICYTEGVGSETIVSTPLSTAEAEETGFWGKFKTDNIKYENPIVTAFEKIIGKNKDAAIKINGIAVDKDVVTFATNSLGLNTVSYLMQLGIVGDVDNFDWNGVEEETGLSYLELSKGMAIENLVPIYAVIAEGEKRGIVFDKDDEKQITDWIAQQKEAYGEEFEEILKKSGYADEETLYEMQKIQLYMQKVYMDIEENISGYVTPQIKASLGDDMVTVKHILVQFEADDEGNITDQTKAKAKAEAEEVLAKVKAGSDFDKLIEEYNDDPGMTDEGYTFANDGTMVQEFTDASFALEVGAVSELVETTYGYHIIKRMERAVTADDYIDILSDTVDVKIKKGVFDKVSVTINLNDYFGEPAEAETEETAE